MTGCNEAAWLAAASSLTLLTSLFRPSPGSREGEQGGRFEVPIWVNVKISFVPLRSPAVEPLELLKEVRFPPLPNQRWSATPGPAYIQKAGFVLADTDGDGAPDTFLPGTSPNFNVGRGTAMKIIEPVLLVDCHDSGDCSHCV